MMTKKKVISVVGARPQFIKLAPLSRALSKAFRHTIVHTGQHYDTNMSAVFFRQLGIPQPNHNLCVRGSSHGDMTGRMLVKLEKAYEKEKPAFVLVYGDTNTTLAAALASAKMAIPVGHVEAGMRSHVDHMPEEINRRVVDHVSHLLFCPTKSAVNNLKAEGIRKKIIHAGDLMFELLDQSGKAVVNNRRLLAKYGLEERSYLYLTFHRAANVDNRTNLQQMIESITCQPFPILFPIHPRTRARLAEFKLIHGLKARDNTFLVEPLNYLDNLAAVRFARAVLTDSGGLQKEALFLGTPVLTLREETEWQETLSMGNRLVGLDKNKISEALESPPRVKVIEYRVGGRKPSQIIVSELSRFLGGG